MYEISRISSILAFGVTKNVTWHGKTRVSRPFLKSSFLAEVARGAYNFARGCTVGRLEATQFMKGLAMVTNRLTHFAALGLMLVSAQAGATPGATDGNGCHTSARIGHHCHVLKPGAAERAASAARSADERRLRRECKGRPNAGACAGYAR